MSNLRTLLLATASAATLAGQPQQVTFRAADNTEVFGTLYGTDGKGEVQGKSRPIILLFHQADSNRAEYAPIAPKLVELGFNALAIDQRSGGSMWGVRNRTAARFRKKQSYMAALQDMEAAWKWTQTTGYTGPVLVWGSSYSAALVFLLAAEHPEIKALLAFSPGEYLGSPDTVKTAAAKVTIPVFLTSATDPEEVANAKSILDVVPSKMRMQFTPGTTGVHGSSTLRTDRNPKGAPEVWQAVSQFLSQFRS